jgi:uncharacterized membrane protein YfcA
MVYGSWLSRPVVVKASVFALSTWVIVEFADFAQAVAESRPGAWPTAGIATVVLVAALISSIAGFAFSALAGCVFAYFNLDPVNAVRTILVCSLAIQLYAVWKLRASIRWRPVWPLLLGGSLTLPLGVWLLVRLDAALYAAGLGVLLIAYGGLVLLRREARVVRGGAWTAVIAGALGGITGGLAGLPGVSATIWCSRRGWDKQQQRAVYQPYILIMQLLTIVWLRWQAPLDLQVARDLAFVPFALVGAIGGLALYQRMTNRHFHMATSALLLVSGAALLSRAA